MKKQNFLKGSLILMLSAAAAKVLGALFKIPLTNILGGVGMSYFSCAYSLFMPIYALTVTGISSAVARLTAQSAALGMYKNAHRVRRRALLIFSLAGLAGSAAVLLMAQPFCRYAASCPEAAAAVAMIAPAVFLGCITAVERGYYEGLSNMYPTAFSQLAEGLVKLGAGLYLCGWVTENQATVLEYFPSGTDIRAVSAAAGILGVTLSSAGAVAVLWIIRLFERRNHKGTDRTLMPAREISRELIRTALPTGVGAVVTNLTALIDMGTVIGCISYFGSRTPVPAGLHPEDMPHFVYGSFAGIALTVFNLVPSVTNMLGRGILPSVTAAWHNNDKNALRRETHQALITAAIIAVPAAAGLAALSGEVLHFLFPRQPDEVEICIRALQLLMPGMVCLCVSFPLFSMLQAIGRAGEPLKIMLIGAAVKLGGNLLLIPPLGASGAALSTTVCYIIILVASLRSFIRSTGIEISVQPFASVTYSGAMCGGAAYLVSDVLENSGADGFTVLALSAAAGGAVYFVFMGMLRESIFPERAGERRAVN